MTFTMLLLSVFLYATLLVAQESGGDFIQPPASPAGGQSAGDYAQDSIYVVGTPLTIMWQTNIPKRAVALGLWQQDVAYDLQPTTTIISNTTLNTYPWDGVPAQNLSLGRIFFMQIYDANNLTLLATTHYFNMTGDKPGSASTSSAAASSTSSAAAPSFATSMSPTTTALKTTHTAASSSAAATSTAAQGSSSDHTLAIGVGVGVGVGVFLAAAGTAIGVFFCIRNRRLKKRQSAAVSSANPLPYEKTEISELASKGTATTISQPSWQHLSRQELQ